MRLFVAILLGLLAAGAIAAGGYLNEHVLRLTPLAGNQLPVVVFGPLVVLLVIGSLMRRRDSQRRWVRPREIAVVVTMCLAACSVPGQGFLGRLTRTVTLPTLHYQQNVSWREAKLLEPETAYHPDRLLPNGGNYDEAYVNAYLTGMRKEDRNIALSAVPWALWDQALSYWVPLALLLGVAMIALAMVVHRQWADHERLKYPIAEVAHSLIAGKDPDGEKSIFRSNLFWIAVIIILVLHLVNGLAAWYPDKMISIPTQLNFFAIPSKFSWWVRHWQFYHLFCPRIWPIVVAFGFIIASEVSLSLGLSQFLFIVITCFLMNNTPIGFQHGSDTLDAPLGWQRAGSSLGVVVMILYFGRRYYLDTLRTAFTFRQHGRTEPAAAWGCRIFLVSMAGVVLVLAWAGLSWPIALLLAVLVMVIFIVQARINVETGLFYTQLVWMPSAVLFGLFGTYALGPRALLIAVLVGLMFSQSIQECLMPFVLNALRISQKQQIGVGRTGSLAAAGFLVAMAVGIPTALWADHNYGILHNGGDTKGPAQQAFEAISGPVDKLSKNATLTESADMGVWDRFANMNPDREFLAYLGVGIVLVFVVSALRQRLPWWPLHPVMFLLWGTNPMAVTSFSFLLGWAVKRALTRFGGTPAYRKGRTFMYGVIAAELLAGIGWMVVGAIYYTWSGQAPEWMKIGPKTYRVFPSG